MWMTIGARTHYFITLQSPTRFLIGVSARSPGTYNEDLVPRDDPTHDWLGKVQPLIRPLEFKVCDTVRALQECCHRCVKPWSSLKATRPWSSLHADEADQAWDQSVGTGRYFQQVFQLLRKEQREEGLGTHVVKSLTNDLKHKYHHVHFDNCFTSFQLEQHLESNDYLLQSQQ